MEWITLNSYAFSLSMSNEKKSLKFNPKFIDIETPITQVTSNHNEDTCKCSHISQHKANDNDWISFDHRMFMIKVLLLISFEIPKVLVLDYCEVYLNGQSIGNWKLGLFETHTKVWDFHWQYTWKLKIGTKNGLIHGYEGLLQSSWHCIWVVRVIPIYVENLRNVFNFI